MQTFPWQAGCSVFNSTSPVIVMTGVKIKYCVFLLIWPRSYSFWELVLVLRHMPLCLTWWLPTRWPGRIFSLLYSSSHTNLERSSLFWTLLQKPPSTSHLIAILVNLNDSYLGKWTLGITVLEEWDVLETFSVQAWRRWISWKGHGYRAQSQELGVFIRRLSENWTCSGNRELALFFWRHILFCGTRPGIAGAKWGREVDMRGSQLAGPEQMGKPSFPRYTLQCLEKWGEFVEVCRVVERSLLLEVCIDSCREAERGNLDEAEKGSSAQQCRCGFLY